MRPSIHPHAHTNALTNTAYSRCMPKQGSQPLMVSECQAVEQMRRGGESKHMLCLSSFPRSLSIAHSVFCGFPLMAIFLSASALSDTAFHPLALLIFFNRQRVHTQWQHCFPVGVNIQQFSSQ